MDKATEILVHNEIEALRAVIRMKDKQLKAERNLRELLARGLGPGELTYFLLQLYKWNRA